MRRKIEMDTDDRIGRQTLKILFKIYSSLFKKVEESMTC